jgi:hypothetical protein
MKIMATSRGQNSFGSDDPQVAMLEQVGADNLDVLLSAYGQRGTATFYLENAVVELAGPQHKELVLSALPRIPALAKVVVANGWQADAKDTLISGLLTGTDFLQDDWMQATASLKDPKAYEALKQYMIRGQNPRAAYDALSAVPEAGDLAPTVAKAWEAAMLGNEWQETSMAPIAIAYGHVDALERVIGELNDARGSFYDKRTLRSLVLRYTPARGGDQAIYDWFDKNRANIVWDAAAKVYRVKEAAATPAPAPAAAAEPNKGG